jgi:hypothetical protein
MKVTGESPASASRPGMHHVSYLGMVCRVVATSHEDWDCEEARLSIGNVRGGVFYLPLRTYLDDRPDGPELLKRILRSPEVAIADAIEDYSLAKFMPEYLRGSHEAAGNSGIYPHNGAELVLAHKTVVEAMRSSEWLTVLRPAILSDISQHRVLE